MKYAALAALAAVVGYLAAAAARLPRTYDADDRRP